LRFYRREVSYLFALIGVTSGIGHFSTIKALELAPASVLAPFAYIQLLWVAILGALVFGDFPDALTLVGIAVVVAGGLLVAASRRRRP
jgi:drug/metabolite transporter (DMT)-like permease